MASRSDYEKVDDNSGVKSELLDDLNLGKRFSEAGVNVKNLIGCNLVSFRMYPNGILSELQGFGKGAVLSKAGHHSIHARAQGFDSAEEAERYGANR